MTLNDLVCAIMRKHYRAFVQQGCANDVDMLLRFRCFNLWAGRGVR
jgi:hypothetical protein